MSEDSNNQQPAGRTFGWPERLAAAIVFFPALVFLSLLPLRPPAVVSADAPPTEFSAARAMRHLEAFAQTPRLTGTPEHARARDYLVSQIEALGLEAVVQDDTRVSQRGGWADAVRIQNVLTRLEGTQGNATVLLMAHYDTVPYSPGASDNGSGVVALLETLRALQAGEPLANDLIVFFPDAEEVGLSGARMFQQHPWAAEVDLVINFEARGTRGPSIMFETGPGTGPAIGTFASLAPRPLASSYSYDLYRLLPNITDFAVFKQAGKPGFNFAFINDIAAYHSRIDTVERMDPRSLQHHGDYALALSRGFGNHDLATLGDGAERVYFNLPFLGLVVYSTSLVLPLAALSVLLAAAVLYLGFSRKRLRAGSLMIGMVVIPVAVAATAAAVALLGRGLTAIFIDQRGLVGHPPLFRLGLILVALAVATALLTAAGRKLGAANLSAGAVVWWLLLTLATAVALPSTSFLLTWPFLFSALALHLLLRGAEGATPPLKTGVLLLLAALPVVLLWAPAVSLVGAAFARGAETVLPVVVGLVASSLIPQIILLNSGDRRQAIALGVLAIGLGLILKEALTARYDAHRPSKNTLFYALDTETGTASWASWDRKTDAWTSQFLSNDPQELELTRFLFDNARVLSADAPAVDLPAASVTDRTASSAEPGTEAATPPEDAVGEAASGTADTGEATPAPAGEDSTPQTASDDGRLLRLHAFSPSQAAMMVLELRSDSAIESLKIAGRPVVWNGGPPAGPVRGILFGGGTEGFEIDVVLDGQDPLQIIVVERAYGLPRAPGLDFEPRPAAMIPDPSRPTDLSMVRSVFEF